MCFSWSSASDSIEVTRASVSSKFVGIISLENVIIFLFLRIDIGAYGLETFKGDTRVGYDPYLLIFNFFLSAVSYNKSNVVF
jgi:hypothetical protein